MARSSKLLTITARLVLVASSLALIRWSITRFAALDAEGRRQFTTAEAFGWPGVLVLAVLIVAGTAFTIAMRLPIQRGFRWSIALWSLIPIALAAHVFLYFRAAEVSWIMGNRVLMNTLFLNDLYFFDDWAARAALAMLAGAALGAAIGRSPRERSAN